MIVRGWPNSLQSFRQRIGRAGRHKRGLAIYIPNALSPLDQYFARHPHLLLESPPERVSFNPSYPLDLAKHLLCAAAESNIPRRRLGHYFGKGAARVANALMEQNLLRANRNGELWAKGRYHRDVNFRGGATSNIVALIDSDSGEQIETTTLDIAQREVFPGALYRIQSEAGQLVTYRSLALERDRAVLQQVPDTRATTSANDEIDTQIQHELVPSTALRLSLDGLDPNAEPPLLQMGLSWCQISQKVTGYQTLTRRYELTCLNLRCVNLKSPLPQQKFCPACTQRTRRAELVTVVDETYFEKPLSTDFSTTIAQLSVNQTVSDYLCTRTEQIKQELVASEGQIPSAREPLWEYSATLLALHSFGHQLLAALPLVVLCAPSDVSYIVQKDEQGFVGGFYDLSEGGNGTSEAIWSHLQPLASAAADLARNCPCTDGCPQCLILPGCPDDNRALSKQIGLLLCDAVARASR